MPNPDVGWMGKYETWTATLKKKKKVGKRQSYREVNVIYIASYLLLYPCHQRVTCLRDLGKPADVVFLDFSKAFDTASRSILSDKMFGLQLNNCIMQWVSNWLMNQA